MIDFKFGELAYFSAEGVLRRPSLSESGGDEIHSPQKNCYFGLHIPFYAWEGRGSDKLLPGTQFFRLRVHALSSSLRCRLKVKLIDSLLDHRSLITDMNSISED